MSQEENKNQLDGFQFEEVKELVEKEESSSFSMIIAGLTISLCAFITIINVFDYIEYSSDKTTIIVEAPKSFENDSPVLAKTIEEWSDDQKGKYITAFTREYVKNLFIEDPEGVEKAVDFLMKHSSGRSLDEAEAKNWNKDELRKMISNMDRVIFKPDSLIDKLYIRQSASNKWVVSVEGVKITQSQGFESVTEEVLELYIESEPISYSNNYGLKTYQHKFVKRGVLSDE